MEASPPAASNGVTVVPQAIVDQTSHGVMATFRTSAAIDLISSALVDAQGMMFSPTRNKRLVFEKRRGGMVDFRYATLDVINDMIRLPLHENGLGLVTFNLRTRNGYCVRTRVFHRSGQWYESDTPILQEEAGPQAFGSAHTMARRYGICGLLNICAESDDDGNEAAGNQVRPMQPGLAEAELREKLSRLFHMANLAQKPLDITNLLKAWSADLHDWMAFADQADRADSWEKLTRLIPNAIRRVHGDEMATAWSAAVLAQSLEELTVLLQHWDGEWKPARLAMKAAALDGYGLLWEHLRMQAARVARQAEEAIARAVAAAQPVPASAPAEPAAAPAPASLEGEGSWLKIEAALATPALTPAAEALPDTVGFFVLDEEGEPATDAVASRSYWAKLYASQHHGSTDRHRLADFNARGLDWACEDQEVANQLSGDVGAWIIQGGAPSSPPPALPPALPLEDLVDVELPLPPPAPRTVPGLRVEMPRTHRDTPDLGRYLLAVKIALNRLGDREALEAWIEANSPTWDALPTSTRLQVRALVVACERVLGLERAA